MKLEILSNMLFIFITLIGLAVSAPQFAREVEKDKARQAAAIKNGNVERAIELQKEISIGSNAQKTNQELAKDYRSLMAARATGNTDLIKQYTKEVESGKNTLEKQKDNLEKVVEGKNYAKNELKRDQKDLAAAIKAGDSQKAMTLGKEIQSNASN